ncbi:MAG TPA: hypothetical protein DD670_10610 [Planctomycetaceae bacterium]|nr:hypothetical protein [Planctomycetaceae bacterium]
MKRLIFSDLLLLSPKEKAARRLTFHPSVTVIKGPNDTGKSSVIKTIYRTLGAVPPQVHPNWEAASVRSAVRFTIDGVAYRILRDGRRYTLFDASDTKIRHFDSVTNGLSPYFATLFDFHLLLRTKKDEGQPATPAFLFLPFYVDQDIGWVKSWSSFERLGQFVSPKSDMVYYHTGVKPNAYYKAKVDLADAVRRLESLREERQVIEKVIHKIDLLLGQVSFDIDIVAYEREITELLTQCNTLRVQEETIKEEIVRLHNARMLIQSQLTVTIAAATELHKDFVFAAERLDDRVDCPTCGATYENSFSERFHMAADEDRCRELISDLQEELRKNETRISAQQKQVGELGERLCELRSTLDAKQGEVKLLDVIRSEGRKEVRGVLKNDIATLDTHIGEADGKVEKVKAEMARFTDRQHSKRITESYRSRMRSYLATLAVVGLSEQDYTKLDCTIKESGSDLPRALLAYYYSILQTIQENSSSTFCPIVIDSPKQQDQDDQNWRRILAFIRDNRPTDSQLILGLVDDLGEDLGGDVVELSDTYHALQKSEFDPVMEEMRPLLDASLAD